MFPIVAVEDVEAAARFYCEQLGFDETYRFGDEFVVVSGDGADLGLTRRKPGGHEMELCVYVDDVDEAVTRLQRAGAEVLKTPEDMPWGERMAYVAPPGGTVLHLAAKIAGTD